MSTSIIYYAVVLLASIAGFIISFYIWYKKQKQQVMVCPLNFECHAVINSKHSKFLGIPVEMMGLFYYAAVYIIYLCFIAFPHSIPPVIFLAAIVMTTGALFFSLYLTSIQIFSIKEFCSWCLASALLSIIIFSMAVLISNFTFVPLLSVYHQQLVILHLIVAALGLGAATIADILFFKFLKDFIISEWEVEVLHTLSQIIWLVLAVIVITGIALYLPQAEFLNHSPKFLLKVTVVVIIVVNGLFLNLLVSPNLIRIFGTQEMFTPYYAVLRKVAFALGSVSATSWYSAFILGTLPFLSTNYFLLLLVYICLLAVAITCSQVMEMVFSKEKNKREGLQQMPK